MAQGIRKSSRRVSLTSKVTDHKFTALRNRYAESYHTYLQRILSMQLHEPLGKAVRVQSAAFRKLPNHARPKVAAIWLRELLRRPIRDTQVPLWKSQITALLEYIRGGKSQFTIRPNADGGFRLQVLDVNIEIKPSSSNPREIDISETHTLSNGIHNVQLSIPFKLRLPMGNGKDKIHKEEIAFASAKLHIPKNPNSKSYGLSDIRPFFDGSRN